MYLGLLDCAIADKQKLLALDREILAEMLLSSHNVVISDRSLRRFGRSIGTSLDCCGTWILLQCLQAKACGLRSTKPVHT